MPQITISTSSFFRVSRWITAFVFGASPTFVALLLVVAIGHSTRADADVEWLLHLADHRDDFISALIVSSVVVAVFCALLRWTWVLFVAPLQPLGIQVIFIFVRSGRDFWSNLPLLAITVLPLGLLLLAFLPEVRRIRGRHTDKAD